MSSPGLSKAIHSIPERAGSLLHSEGQISLPVCSAGEAQIFAGTEKCPSFIILFLVGIAAEVRINSFKKKKKMFVLLTMHFQQLWDFTLPQQAGGFSRTCHGLLFLE